MARKALTRSEAALERREIEVLRQEAETFDQAKAQDERKFFQQLVGGYVALVLFIGVLLLAALIIINSKSFPEGAVTAATVALFGDTIGIGIWLFKSGLTPVANGRLSPVSARRTPVEAEAASSSPEPDSGQ